MSGGYGEKIMSGGYFDHSEFKMEQTADGIQEIIDRNESIVDFKMSEETIFKFKSAVKYLRMAAVMTKRIDYLIEGDDGEDNFHKRWDEDLDELEEQRMVDENVYKPNE